MILIEIKILCQISFAHQGEIKEFLKINNNTLFSSLKNK